MKNTLNSLLFVLLLAVPGRFAFAAEDSQPETVETELVEKTLDSAQVTESEKIEIRVSKSRAFILDAYPDVGQMKEALGLNIPDKVKNEILARGGKVEDVNPLDAYEHLSNEKKEEFRQARLHFLANAARILNSTKFAFGAGSLVGNGFSFIITKVKKVFGKGTPKESVPSQTFRERSDRVILNILKGMDYKLWSQAPLLIDSNEFGLTVSVGILAESGVMKKGAGGAEEMGFALAFNKTNKAFVFEVFHNSEAFHNTFAAVSVIGVVGKLGMTMGHREGAETIRGYSFYPPMIPGYSTNAPEYFSAGLSSSVGFPPPPIADLLTFTNKFERHSLIRVTVSPVVKGFVRLQAGDVKGTFKCLVFRVADILKAIAYKVHILRKPGRCVSVFAH